jgi:PIN domain nuclease of toxin-antitoxin system
MLLVDTHILVWDALTPQRLSSPAVQALSQANQGDGLLISDISLWEIAMLVQKGRVKVNTDCQSFITLILQANNCQVRPITPQIATLSVGFPNMVNQDPADRLILATAAAENVPLMTADQNLQAANIVPTIW